MNISAIRCGMFKCIDFDAFQIPGLSKKLRSAAKKHDIIGGWIRSIVNHLYWCVASTQGKSLIKLK